MKKYKSMIVLIILLILCLNTIHASEYESNNSNLNNSNTNYQTENPDESNIFNVTDNSGLQKALNNVSRTDKKYNEINLHQDSYSIRTPLNTNKNEKTIIINGNNSTISGSNNNRFATISQKVTLILNNLTIRNMQFEIGGAISNSGTLIANNCIFENNTSTGTSEFGGGAIYNEGSMILNNCVFKHNTAYFSGSSIYNNINLQNHTNVLINNSYFENNHALDGSTLHNLGCTSINITNSIFQNNTATGSTIFNGNSNMTIQNSIITKEQSKSILTNNVTCNLINTTIKENFDMDYIIENDNILNIYNTSISCNSANSFINNKYNTQIKDSKISNNIVNQSIIKNILTKESSTVNLTNSTLSDNTANLTCGLINTLNSSIYIDDSIIQNNTSLKNEGVIVDYNGKTRIIKSKFINNTSEDLFKGHVETFVEVRDNVYLGNNLKIEMNVDHTNENDNVLINVNLSAEEIYNTTVNQGNILLYQNNELLSNTSVENNNMDIHSAFDTNSNLTLKLIYDGQGHFINKTNNLIVSAHNDEYTLEITNITEEFVYGDNIQYVITLNNTGNSTIKNLKIENLLPANLILLNSSINITNNMCIQELNINETLNIYINASARYDDLNLLFNIYDENNDRHFFIEKNIKFLSPFISLRNITANIGEYTNITCNINNYNKKILDNVIVSFRNQQEEFNNLSVENNMFTILNYNISDKYSVGEYTYEIICYDNTLNHTFSNKSKIFLSKLNSFSIISTNITNNIVNISAIFYDERNKIIESGNVLVKINGRSVKTLKINNTGVFLENYIIDKKYQKDNYEILLIFTGNNKYNSSRNSTNTTISKKNVDINISYEIQENYLHISSTIKDYLNKSLFNEGYFVLKINGKSVFSKIRVNGSEITLSVDISQIYNIKTIGISYYGCNLYNEKSLTIPYYEKT